MGLHLLRGWSTRRQAAPSPSAALGPCREPAGSSSPAQEPDGSCSCSPHTPAAAAPPAAPSTEHWGDGATCITVQERPGQLLQVVGRARVPLPPQTLFAVITHPESERIFRHLLSCENRRVLQEGGPGEVTVVESEHRAAWRFLLFSGTLRTRLRVEQAPEEGRVRFALLPGGSRLQPMRRFDGAWSVAGSEGHHDATLTLEQVVQPAVHLPPPLGRLFKSIACQQLRGIFEDVQAEARRIREGQPTLWRAQQE